jgi:autotransporter translocation and assembly factor TamB
MDMSLLLVAYPWMRRANLKIVAALALLTVVFFGAWYAIGFGFPTTSGLAYFLNGASRVSSQLAVSFTVAGKLKLRTSRAFVRR